MAYQKDIPPAGVEVAIDVINLDFARKAYHDMLTALKRVAYSKCLRVDDGQKYCIIMDAADRQLVVETICKYDDLADGSEGAGP